MLFISGGGRERGGEGWTRREIEKGGSAEKRGKGSFNCNSLKLYFVVEINVKEIRRGREREREIVGYIEDRERERKRLKKRERDKNI